MYQRGSWWTHLMAEGEGLGLRGVFGFFSKSKLLIAAGAILFGVIAAIWSFGFMHPVYQATSVLKVTDPPNNTSLSPSTKTVSSMDNYLTQINSDEVRQMMVKDLGLKDSPGSIFINVVDSTRFIEVSVRNRDPKLAVDMANSISKQFLILSAEKKDQETVEPPVKKPPEQSLASDSKLQAAKDALRDYQQKNRGTEVLELEISRKSEGAASLEADLDQSTADLAKLQPGMDKLEKDMRSTPRFMMKKTEDPVTGKVVSDWEPNPQYTSLYDQYVEKVASVDAEEKEISEIKLLLQKRRAELKSLQAELANYRLTQDKLQQEIDRLESNSETPAIKNPRPLISNPSQPNEPNVVIYRQAAVPSSPMESERIMVIVIAVLVGLIFSTVIAFVLDMIDDTIKTPEDVELSLGVPAAAVIPPDEMKVSKKKRAGRLDLAIYRRPKSAQAQSYLNLGSFMEMVAKEEGCRSIMVSSPGYSDGKATVAASLAIVLAVTGHKVMLIDGDLRRPSMHQIFNWDNRRGFSNCIMEDLLPEGYASRILVDNLAVMTSGPRLISPTELLTSPKVSVIIGVLQKNYDYIIFNSPPVLEGSDALILADKVEGVLLVLGLGHTKKKHAVEAYKRLEMVKARIVGVVVD